MTRTLTLVAALLALPGCYVYTDDPGPAAPHNAAPAFTYADAGCYPDDYYRDFVWYFDSDVTDPDGANDVSEVYADVYDSYNGEWVDGFDLYREDGVTWYSAWVGSTTYLDCTYPDYVVDLTAVDIFGASDVATVDPTTW
jgi:hypothetical protein